MKFLKFLFRWASPFIVPSPSKRIFIVKKEYRITEIEESPRELKMYQSYRLVGVDKSDRVVPVKNERRIINV